MKVPLKLYFTRTTGKCLLCGMALSTFLAGTLVFGDDQQVIDELYNQIMGASTQEQETMDNGSSKSIPVDQLKISPAEDPNSEKLRQEIEKITEEVKLRHSDAVKFMREDR